MTMNKSLCFVMLAGSLLLGPIPRVLAGDIHDAAGAGDVDKVKALLAANPSCVSEREANGDTALHVAAGLGMKRAAEALIDGKADLNATNSLGLTPIEVAQIRGETAMVDFLLTKNISADVKTAILGQRLHQAINDKDTALAESLVTNNASLELVNVRDNQGNQAIHIAALNGNADLISFLLAHKADPTTTNYDGAMPLHAAASLGRTAVVELLLKQNVPVNARMVVGLTALTLASDHGYVEIVRDLLARDASPNLTTKTGVSALLSAADRGYVDIAKMLLDKGANINIRGDKEATPLHFAVRNGNIKMVQFLLDNKAEVNLRTRDGYTPLTIAKQKKWDDIGALLQKYGGTE